VLFEGPPRTLEPDKYTISLRTLRGFRIASTVSRLRAATQSLSSRQWTADTKSVPNVTDLWQRVVGLFWGEKEGTEHETVVLRPLPHVRSRCRTALYAAFRCPAVTTTCGPEAFRD
jgi:hypothetical protein